MNLKGRRAVVIGLGRSGVAAARLLLGKGASVVAADASPREKFSKEARALELIGIELAPSSHGEAALANADLAVISPGVPSFAALESFEKSGREVIGEMELASRFFTTPIALIGGTNGKSTTTGLTAAIFEAAGKKVFIGGNYGTPLAEVVAQEFDVLVLEISSFQAERVPTLHARAHALLNITDDHLDRYPSSAEYADAKGNPFERMTSDDIAIIPAGDEVVRRQANRGQARIVTFGIGEGDIALLGGDIVSRLLNVTIPRSALKLNGAHNVLNACAAMGVALDMGASQEAIETSFRTFDGLDHRTAFIREVGGIRYYDDSKGTNVGASVTALRGLTEPKAVLIAGGRDKLGAYGSLVDALRDKGRALVVIGEAADRIAAAASGVLPIHKATSMVEAVKIARELARSGDAVLLSPACSSFDMFKDYKDRGDQFARAVHEIVAAEEPAP
jgi:UDP-N-acetylmuramoylalanine--D-glutamate ligase